MGDGALDKDLAAALSARNQSVLPFQIDAEALSHGRGRKGVHQRADDAHLGTLVQQQHLPAEALGMSQVVCVHSGHITPAALRQAAVEGGDEPFVRCSYESQPRFTPRVGGDRGHAAVARAIVDDDYLEVLQRLCRKAGESFPDGVLRVEDGQQHGDQGIGHRIRRLS